MGFQQLTEALFPEKLHHDGNLRDRPWRVSFMDRKGHRICPDGKRDPLLHSVSATGSHTRLGPVHVLDATS